MAARLAACTLLLAIACLPLAASDADLILKNGRIWTADASQPWADAVAIRRNRIVAVGDNLQVAATAGPNTHVVDLNGRLTIPGFDDSHAHLVRGALRSLRLDLTGACNIADMQKRIRDFAAAHPKDPWIVGTGWAYSCFPNHALPTRSDLDAAVRDRPAYLTAEDGHTAWVNTRALQLAGITRATKYTGPGRIVTDASGDPSGALSGGAAALVHKLVPDIPREQKLAALEQAVRMLSSLGVTSIGNVGGDDETLALLEELERQHKLNVRVAVYISVSPQSTPDAIDRILDLRQAFREPHVRIAGVDLLLDGQIEAHSAALLEPYSDAAGVTGKAMWSPEAFNEMVTLCDSGGLQIATHAVGDRAVRMALDGYEYARHANESHDSRFRIEHGDTIAPPDVARFARLGVVASMIPVHADPGVADVWSRAVGPERLKLAFAWHALEQSGARLVFGSDWPSSISADPIRGIQTAVNRQTGDRIGLEEALRAWTVNGAYATFDNRTGGKLRTGMLADVVVLSQDLFEIPPSQIWKTRVDMTVFDGQVVYTRQ
jgi:predicted amidohydrolase YtcJ